MFVCHNIVRDSIQRYWINRPIYEICSPEKPLVIKKLNKIKNENAIMWWKYAISSIRKLCKENRTRIDNFKASIALEKYFQRVFIEHFVKLQMGSKEFTSKIQKLYEKIILTHDLKTLFKYGLLN